MLKINSERLSRGIGMSRGWFLAGCAVIVLVMPWLIWLSDRRVSFALMDLKIFLNAGRDVSQGHNLYASTIQVGVDTWGYIYAPLPAWIFAPLSHLSLADAGHVWTVMNIVCVLASVRMLLLHLGVPDVGTRRALTLLFSVPLIWFGPFDDTFFYGQVAILLMTLVLLDMTVAADSKWAGVATGLATGIKALSGVFVLYLLLRRRYRAALTAAATFLVTTALGFAVAPSESWRYWTYVFPRTGSKMGPLQSVTTNSLLSAIARLLHSDREAVVCWVMLGGLVLVAGLASAAVLGRHDEVLGAGVCALVTNVCMPIAWSHYWVWAAPAMMCLARYAARERAVSPFVVIALFVTVLHARAFQWLVPLSEERKAHLSLLQQLQDALYPLSTIAFCVFLHLWIRRRVFARELHEIADAGTEVPARPSVSSG